MELVLLAASYMVGLLAVLVPILLHLRPRAKNIIIRFAATRFLEPVLRRTARRLRFQNLVLMALRVILVALVVLAFTMPLMRNLSATALSFDRQTSVVLVVDASFSMGFRDQDTSRFDKAKAAAGRILEALSEKDDAAIILAGAASHVVPPGLTRQVGLLRDRLSEATLTYGKANLRQALLAAGKVREASDQPNHHVFVFTDMQRQSFLALAGKPLPPETLGGAPLTLVDVGNEASPNTAVTAVEVVSSRRAPSVPLDFTAEVRHFGRDDVETVATLVFDGKTVAQRALSIPSGGKATAAFTHTFYRPGFYGGYVEVQPDSLSADDRHYLAVQVRPPAPVLCVDGDLSAVVSRQETFFFRTALAPGGTAKEEANRGGKPVVCAPGDLERQTLEDYRVVVLANVPEVTAKMVAALEKFVAGGGSVLIYLGDRVQPEVYNRALWSAEGGLLPGKLTRTVGGGPRRPLSLGEINFQHPLLARFRDNKLGDLGRVAIYQAIGVDATSLAKDATVLARYADGTPAIIERAVGRGKVLLWTTSADSDWTNLPVQPVFVPLVHELVYYLSAEAQTDKPYTVDDVVRIPLDLSAAGATASVRNPAGKTFAARVETEENRLVAEFSRTDLPGIYEVTIHEGDKDRTQRLAVNPDPAESDLTRIEKEGLEGCFHPNQAWTVATPEHLADALAQGRQGQKLWIWLLYAALGIYILEALYAGRLSVDAEPPRSASRGMPVKAGG